MEPRLIHTPQWSAPAIELAADLADTYGRQAKVAAQAGHSFAVSTGDEEAIRLYVEVICLLDRGTHVTRL